MGYNETQEWKGQLLATKANGETKRILVGDDGSLIRSGGKNVAISSTRPNDVNGYIANDVTGTLAPATVFEFTNISTVVGGDILITDVSLRIDTNTIPSGIGSFILHLYNASPTPLGDNVQFNLIAADRTKYLGYIVISMPIDLGDTLWSQNGGVNFKCKLANDSTSLFGQLVTSSAFTPSSGTVKTVTLNTLEV